MLTKKTCLNPTQNDSLEGQWLSSVILQLSTSAWDKYVPEITTLQLHLLTHTPSAEPPSQETHNRLQVSAQLLRFHKVKLASVGQLVFNPSLPRLCVGESKFWDSSLKSPIRSCHRHTCCTRPGSEAPLLRSSCLRSQKQVRLAFLILTPNICEHDTKFRVAAIASHMQPGPCMGGLNDSAQVRGAQDTQECFHPHLTRAPHSGTTFSALTPPMKPSQQEVSKAQFKAKASQPSSPLA